MADDKTKTAPEDGNRINVHEDYEVNYWTKTLGCTKDELNNAVKEAGTSVKAVREYLGK